MSTRRRVAVAFVLAAATGALAGVPFFHIIPEDAPEPVGEEKMLRAPGNYFNVADEQKLLPEVMSVLKFEPRDHATPGDLREEAEAREHSHWGRLYVDGWPDSVQYLRGHFGLPPPDARRLPLILADPLDACADLANAAEIKRRKAVVLATRGVCTFGTKAKVLEKAVGGDGGLATLLLVNNEAGVLHAPGPDAHEVRASVNMISQWEGDKLVRAVAAKPPGFFNASLVAMNCIDSSKNRKLGNSLCEEVALDDTRYVKREHVDGGALVTATGRWEYALAKFGVAFDVADLGVVHVGHACAPLAAELKGRAALARRGGGCDFLEKTKHAVAAGAGAVFIANESPEDGLVRAGCHPRWAAADVDVPVGLISSDAGDALVADARPDLNDAYRLPVASAKVEPADGGHGAAWEDLEKYADPAAWPRSAKAKARYYAEISKSMSFLAYPERQAWLAAKMVAGGLGEFLPDRPSGEL